MKQNKPMTPREEFLQMMSCLSVEVDSKEGAEKALDKIYNWHISEMEKLLEKISDMANLIKETRKELGESQTVFGARFGLPHHSISYYENGHYEAPYSVIKFCIRQSLNKLKEEK